MLEVSTVSIDDHDWSHDKAPREDGSKSLIILDPCQDCKWPVGGMYFCGKSRRMGSSYCREHHRVAHVGDAAA